jgi:dienelactone hydrolase
MEQVERWKEQEIDYAGVIGENVEILSRNPKNYFQAITAIKNCETVKIDGKLFLPKSKKPLPIVIIVPGSLGVGPNHKMHAETLVNEGYAVFLLDPFGARSVESTVENQTQYSFAASAYDLLATYQTLCEHPLIDTKKIAAQGHSRGGSAVLMASMRHFADPLIGSGNGFSAIYSVYPWCGHQFKNPQTETTQVRAIVGEIDNWVSIKQIETQIEAIKENGGEATMRIIDGAHHSFDRHEPVHAIPTARVAPDAPITFLEDDGAMLDPQTQEANPDLVDYDIFVHAMKQGYGRLGADLGGIGDQPEKFKKDMLDFYAQHLMSKEA